MTDRKTLGLKDTSDTEPALNKKGRGWKISDKRLDELHDRAREMKRFASPANKALAKRFAEANLGRYTFKRFAVVGSAIVDFNCHNLGMAISIEEDLDEERADPLLTRRDKSLEAVGIRVMRIKASDILENLDAVLQRITAGMRMRIEDKQASRRARHQEKPRKLRHNRLTIDGTDSMLLTTLALSMSLQSAGETAVAIENDNPETWTVEYPRLIQPFVADYRGCLNFTIRYVTGVADFEAQHRNDVPRCSEVREKAIAKSKVELADAKTRLSDAEIDRLFSNIGMIHVQRGRDLDQQFAIRLQAAERAEAAGPPPRAKPFVINLPDPSVVRSGADPLAQSETSISE